jgi:hypothetical protein
MIDATDGCEGGENLITSSPAERRVGPDCKVSRVIELGPRDADGRKTLLEGLDFAGANDAFLELSARRDASYLFLRYALGA